MGSSYYRREKITAWIITETFNIFGKDKVKDFLESDFDLGEKIRWIDYEYKEV